MKKIIATASAVAMLFVSSASAFAVSNTNTGAKSVNIAVELNRSSVTTRNLNLAGVVNVVDSSASSGNAKADKNTGGGNMALTGNAVNKVKLNNNLTQTNTTVVGTCGCSGGSTASNDTTGYKSLNVAVVSNSSTVNTTNTNGAFVLNLVSSSASTGNSSASMNTGGGNVASTGNASTTTTINNTINQGNTTVVNP